MKLSELGKRTPSLGVGVHKVIFDHIEYVEDENDNISAYRIYIEGYQPIYNKWFDDGRNYALNALLDQLDGELDMRPAAVNKHKGKEIMIEMKRSADGRYINANFRVKGASLYK